MLLLMVLRLLLTLFDDTSTELNEIDSKAEEPLPTLFASEDKSSDGVAVGVSALDDGAEDC